MLREERRVLGFDMSVNWRRSVGDLARRRFWLVERVWLWIGIWSWFWIRVLNWEIVMFGLSIETRSSPSLLRIRIIIFLIDCFMEIERERVLSLRRRRQLIGFLALLCLGWEREWDCFSVFICDCLLDGEAGQEDTKVIFPRTMYKRCRRVLRLFAAAILEPF